MFPSDKTIRINGQRTILLFFIITLLCEAIIVAFDLATSITSAPQLLPDPFADLFNMALEANLLSWFSSIQFFVAGILCAILFALAYHKKSWAIALAWAFAAAMFTFMSLDDVASIHERTGLFFKMVYTGEIPAQGAIQEAIIRFPSYFWQAVFLPFFAGFAILLLFLGAKVMLYRHAQAAIVCGLFCYVTAVGLDFFEGFGAGFEGIPLSSEFFRGNIVHLAQVLEEFLELLGTSIISVALLGECLYRIDGYRLRSAMS